MNVGPVEAGPSPGRDERFVLAVDLGTGGLKVGLVSLTGHIAWQEHFPVKTTWLDDGGAVQDPEEWWQIITAAARDALAREVVPPEQVVAVSVTGQWASAVPVDGDGSPVGDCLMWMDRRGAPHSQRVVGGPVGGYSPAAAAVWIRRCGAPPSPQGDDFLGHLLFMEKGQPSVARAARWYLEPVDYLSMRFTGVAAASPASMTAAWLTDTRRPDIRNYDPVLVGRSGVDARKLPPLHPTGSVIAMVRPSVAAYLGLSRPAQVVTGTPDIHSAAVGAGTVLDHEAHMAIGTTSWISCPVGRKKTDLLHQIATIPGLTADGYLVVDNQDSAGRCLEWLRQVIPEVHQADYPDLIRLASTAPAGSDGVIFTPWLKGEHSPIADRQARGGFHNLSLSTTGAHLARAVLEGVAYNSRWLLQGAEKFTRHRLDPIRLIGGGAQSDLWCQIMADVTDRTIERVSDPLHANLRGAAIFAGMALGEVDAKEVRRLARVDTTFRPDGLNRDVYDRLFAEFPRLYRAQKGTFRRLNAKSHARSAPCTSST